MEVGSHLASLLQFQLASDASAKRYLPYCLSTLSSECLAPSSHRSKWASRINSLLHSKEAGARWSGLCLANKSALLSQSLMIERAQSWLSVVIPMFTKSEPLPVLKAAVRLIVTIFTTATDIAEFHRQVCIPNAVKVTSLLLPLASQFSDTELKVTVITSLSRLIRQYPTAHRASCAQFMSFALQYLNGSPITQSNHEVVHAAAELYSTLPLTSGKVGGVNLWRKSIDDTLAFAWDAFFALRTTFPRQDRETVAVSQGSDPQVHVQANIDRLRCAIIVFEHLLCARMQRPVQLPLGKLVKIAIALLSVAEDGKVDAFIDPYIRPLEVAITPEICSLGCSLIQCLCQRYPIHLDAYCSKLLSILAFQLEQCRKPALKCALLEALLAILKVCKLPDTSALSRISQICLRTAAEVVITTRDKAVEPSSSKVKNGNKKASTFEGEEVFKTSAQVTCSTRETQIALLASLEVLKKFMESGSLPPAMRSTIARVIVSIMLSLPSISPSSISPDASFVYELRNRVQQVGLVVAQGTTNVMSKSLPYMLGEVAFEDNAEAQRQLEILIHPRLPPLVRSVPFLEALSLFKAEESQEEADILSSIGLHVEREVHSALQHQDVSMGDAIPARPETISTDISPPAQPPPPTVQVAPTPSQKQPVSLAPSTKPMEEPMKQLQQTANRTDVVDELPSLTIEHKTFASTSVPLVKQPRGSTPISSYKNPSAVDEDEEMPGINMDSDSEHDE